MRRVGGDAAFVAEAVDLRLLLARLLDGRAPGRPRDLPVAVGPPLGDHVRAVPAGAAEGDADRRPLVAVVAERPRPADELAVGVDAVDVDGRRPLLDELDLGHVEAGRHVHDRVVGVLLVNHLGDVVEGVPHLEVGVEEVVLVAEPPHQDGRVVLVGADDLAEPRELGLDGPAVVVVEALALLTGPETERHAQPLLVGLVEDVDGLARAPRPDRVGPVLDGAVEVHQPADPSDVIRLTAAVHRPRAVLVLSELDGDGPFVGRLVLDDAGGSRSVGRGLGLDGGRREDGEEQERARHSSLFGRGRPFVRGSGVRNPRRGGGCRGRPRPPPPCTRRAA